MSAEVRVVAWLDDDANVPEAWTNRDSAEYFSNGQPIPLLALADVLELLDDQLSNWSKRSELLIPNQETIMRVCSDDIQAIVNQLRALGDSA